MTKRWLPKLDRLIVEQDPAPFLHPNSGFEIPENQRENFRPNTGKIVRVGPGMWVNGTFCPVDLQAGQRIMFVGAETLTKIEHDGKEHLVMRETDVLLVLEEEGKLNEAPIKEGGSLNSIIEQYKKAGNKSITFTSLYAGDADMLRAQGYTVESNLSKGQDSTTVSWK